MKTNLLIIMLSVIALQGIAQRDSVVRLTLQNSFQSYSQHPQLSTFTFTHSKNGDNSYLIDAGLGINFTVSKLTRFMVFSEFHRNTLTNRPQHVFQNGIGIEWLTPDFQGTTRSKRAFAINLNAKHSKNEIEGSQSIQLTGELSPISTSPAKFATYSALKIGQVGIFSYCPSIGIEEQYNYKNDSELTNGNILRAVVKCYLCFIPLPNLTHHQIELSADLTERYDLVNTTTSTAYNHFYMQAGLSYVFLKTKKETVKAGIWFNKGCNPAQGLKEEQYFFVGIKAGF